MTWLYVPHLPNSRFSQVTRDTLSPSSFSLGVDTELWVMSKGTPSPRRLSRLDFRTVPWIRRLSGIWLNPSTAEAIADEWISLLPLRPASPFPAPENNGGTKTGAPSEKGAVRSPTCSGSSPKSNRRSVSSRTRLNGSREDTSSPWGGSYIAWVTESKSLSSSLRKTLGRRIAEPAFSSWPTPRTTDTTGSGRHGEGAPDLKTSAANWATPTVSGDQNRPGASKKAGWGIQAQARNWATPNTGDCDRGIRRSDGKRGILLAEQIRLWPTATARDWRSGSVSDATMERNSRQLNELAFRFSLRHSKGRKKSGWRSSEDVPHLNPLFDEWLMGLPFGWTDPSTSIGRTGSGLAGMDFYRWVRRMRSLLWRLGL